MAKMKSIRAWDDVGRKDNCIHDRSFIEFYDTLEMNAVVRDT